MAMQNITSTLFMDQLRGLDQTISKRTSIGGSAESMAEGIGQVLENAVRDLDKSQKSADTGIAQLVAGEPVDLHQVMLQMEESMVKLNLALQVRNKVIEAYQEVQRMQI